MAWLDTIKELSFVMQSISCNWICFFKYETVASHRHTSAIDFSVSDQSRFGQRGAVQKPHVSCFFAFRPHVECCELSAHNFFSHPAVRRAHSGSFLIPYYAEDSYLSQSQSPFIKFSYIDWIELSGHPDAEKPLIRSSGTLVKRILSALSESAPQSSSSHSSSKHRVDKQLDSQGWHSTENSESLLIMFERLKSHMRRGDCYLANGTTRMSGPARSELNVSLSQFVSQWTASPSRYGVYVNCGDELPLVVCFSPERFIQRIGRSVLTEPIKGTAQVNTSQHQEGAQCLWESTKEMCEQKMVTDLLRNDLNKVCTPGSVVVESPFEIRVAGSLLQMQSVVRGHLACTDTSNSDILMKTLPAGSVTGTPKYAVGKLISDVEKTERGYYTGVFAHLESQTEFDSTILIRGFFADSQKWYAGVGAGITTLSDSKAEAAEFELKWSSFASRLTADAANQNCGKLQQDMCNALLQHQIHLHASGSSSISGPDVERQCEESASDGHFQMEPKSTGLLIEIAGLNEILDLPTSSDGFVLFVDHYDSFSENLIAAFRSRGLNVVRIFSAPSSHSILPLSQDEGASEAHLYGKLVQKFHAVVFSPGPGVPSEYPLSQALIRAVPNDLPVLGVCLGHQLLLTDSGLSLEPVPGTPIHGRGVLLPQLRHSRFLCDASFKGEATYYNSWQVGVASINPEKNPWIVNGYPGAGIDLCEHRALPRLAVQFHPESFATQSGLRLLNAFVDLIALYKINSQSNTNHALTRTAKDSL